jgi:hypothetical protein
LNSNVLIAGPNRWTSYGLSSDSAVSKVVDRMISVDPAALMAMQPVSSGNQDFSSFQLVAGKWAAQDFPAYAAWVDSQAAPEVRDEAAGIVISKLRSDAHYEEALEWSMSSEKLRANHLFSVVVNWIRTDPERARTWLESAPLTESERTKFQSFKEQ